jgi:hypothetical protein
MQKKCLLSLILFHVRLQKEAEKIHEGNLKKEDNFRRKIGKINCHAAGWPTEMSLDDAANILKSAKSEDNKAKRTTA